MTHEPTEQKILDLPIADLLDDASEELIQINRPQMPELSRLLDTPEDQESTLEDSPVPPTRKPSTAPEGWATNAALAQELEVSYATVRKAARLALEENPLWSSDFASARGPVRRFYAPELVEAIRKAVEPLRRKSPPEGWVTAGSLEEELCRGRTSINKVLQQYRESNPEWFAKFATKRQAAEYYSPELAAIIRKELPVPTPPPDGWVTLGTLAHDIDKGFEVIQRLVRHYSADTPELIGEFAGRRRSVIYIAPELASVIARHTETHLSSPEDWMTHHMLAKKMSVSAETLLAASELYRDEHPEWFEKRFWKGGVRQAEYISPQLGECLERDFAQKLPAPTGWLSTRGLSKLAGIAEATVKRAAQLYRDEHPEWFGLYGTEQNRITEHFSPELIHEIKQLYAANSEKREKVTEQTQLKASLEDHLAEFNDPDKPDAQKLRQLIHVFGAERTTDIFYKFHPEYKKLPLPYVKSRLGEYLGDYLSIRNGFTLDKLELIGGEYLSDATFKEGLTEVMKAHVLHNYNQFKKDHPEVDDQQLLEGFIRYLYQETRSLANAEFDDVLTDVANYYRSLFDDIHKPTNLVEEIAHNRLFPDINQRINILKLAGQNKLLIADEMGLGKSASAILSKEALGIKQALIVVPSNVVETWQTYLSDARGENGKVLGYFKDGQAPRVLVVEDPASLQDINSADYDYVIMSQERLTKRYMAGLKNLNFDMLIVDESHKLKNIAKGKRSENLIELAEQINGHLDKYLVLLSGTPVPNKVSDIAMTLKLLYPKQFEAIPNAQLTNIILKGDVLDVRSLLLPKMEMKELTESGIMPKLEEVTLKVSMSDQERLVYEILLEEDEQTATQKLQTLRQFALNPEMFDATPSLEFSKIQAVNDALQQTYEDKRKVVMFVNGYIEDVIRGDTTIIDKLNVPRDVQIRIIDGNTPKEQRTEIQSQIQLSNGRMLVVVSGQTADVGVDFSGADEVYFYNEPWTEYDKKQQLARVYRPGLKHDLVSRTFLVEQSIEEGIHQYLKDKRVAVEKLLRGIPHSEIEKRMLKAEERRDAKLEVNPQLAEYYFSSWDRMMKIFGHVKELGEEDFKKFVKEYGTDYANCYTDLGSRSYQANASRLSGTMIDRIASERGQAAANLKILDVASGPEMLKRHIADEYQENIVSVDINPHHFTAVDEKRRIGSFLDLPAQDKSADYVNLSLALHYTKSPTSNNHERVQVFKEMNRVLKPSGMAIINTIHTMDIRDTSLFEKAVEKIGFKVVHEHSGEVSVGQNFRTRQIVLQKVDDCTQDAASLAQTLGKQIVSGLKFARRDDIKLRDSRKIAKHFVLNGATKIDARLNQDDLLVLGEEEMVTSQIRQLKDNFGSIKDVPADEIIRSGLVRVFNGRTYVLFKRLILGPGAIIGR